MAGRKTFTAGEVLQATDVNDYLMDQSVMVFAGTAARGSAIPSPTEGMVTYLEDSNQVQVYNGSSFGAIGKILQVVSTAKTDAFSSTSGTFATVTGLSASITPGSTSSKILILLDARVSGTVAAGNDNFQYRLSGGNSTTFVGDAASNRIRAIGSIRTAGAGGNESNYRTRMLSESAIYLDSPNTTSSVTYEMQIKVGVGTAYVNRSDLDDDTTNQARGASSITLMEVAG